jgi:alanine racemase
MKLTRRNFLQIFSLGSLSFFPKKRAKTSRPKLIPKNSQPRSPADIWIELNLENLGWNLKQIRKQTRVPVMAVIKANAYGHGLVEVGRYLDRKGIDSLMVGKFQEAVQLREEGITCPVHNFGPLSAADTDWLVENDVSQSVFTDGIHRLDSSALRVGKKAKVHIHIDTGMGRMGIPHHQAQPYIETIAKLSGIKLMGISTTLTEDPEYDKKQLDRFHSLCQKVEERGIGLGLKHAASSGAIFTLPSAYLDMVRPGITLYGYYPSDTTQAEDKLALRPVLHLKTRVAAVKTLRRGDSVSYHRAYVAKKKVKIAVLPVGYSDGYPTTAVNRGTVLIRGKHCPIIASITANHMEVSLPQNINAEIGDEAVLIGTQQEATISAYEAAQWAGVSSYKILLSLNPLLHRQIQLKNT